MDESALYCYYSTARCGGVGVENCAASRQSRHINLIPQAACQIDHDEEFSTSYVFMPKSHNKTIKRIAIQTKWVNTTQLKIRATTSHNSHLDIFLLVFTGIEKFHDIQPNWRWITCYNTPHSEMTSKFSILEAKRYLISLTKLMCRNHWSKIHSPHTMLKPDLRRFKQIGAPVATKV